MNFTKRLIAWVLGIFGGCTGGAQWPTGKFLAQEPPALTTFYVRDGQPSVTTEPPANSDQWGFSLRYQGEDIVATQVHGDQSRYIGFDSTGLTPESQRGNGRGPVFFRNGNQFGSYIDTRTTPLRVIEGAGPHTAVTYSFRDKPRLVDQPVLSATLNHWIGENSGGVEQLSIIGYFYDRSTAHTIGFVWLAMDNRWDWFEPTVMHDTSVYFVTQPINTSRYATNLSGTSMSQGGFRDLQVDMLVTPDNLRNIINDINQRVGTKVISENLEDYYMDSFGVLHEVFIFNDSRNWVSSGVSFKNVTARRMR